MQTIGAGWTPTAAAYLAADAGFAPSSPTGHGMGLRGEEADGTVPTTAERRGAVRRRLPQLPGLPLVERLDVDRLDAQPRWRVQLWRRLISIHLSIVNY